MQQAPYRLIKLDACACRLVWRKTQGAMGLVLKGRDGGWFGSMPDGYRLAERSTPQEAAADLAAA